MPVTSVSTASKMQLSKNLDVVDICDLKIGTGPDKVLVTYALGSCIAVTAYDPRTKLGGMIHYMLPERKVDPVKAKAKPAMFGDTGLPTLFKALYAAGARKSDLQVYVVGGAATLNTEGNLNIGKRNALLARKLFWKSGITVKKEQTGGRESRTVYLSLTDGTVVVKRPGGKEDVL